MEAPMRKAMACFLGMLAFVGIGLAQPIPGVDIAPFGAQTVWPSDLDLVTILDRMQEAGIQWARFDLCWWSLCEQQAGEYVFVNPAIIPSWNTDRAISLLKERGIEPFPILCYGNKLYDGEQGPYTDAGREAFGNYCYAAASRYKDSVFYWEIWNEPNQQFFWGRTPNPADYARLAIVAAQRIREANPQAIVAGAATSGIDMSFLETAFQNGLLDAVDAITIHPYRGTSPESINTEVANVRARIAAYTSRDIQVWSGEWGYNTYVHNMSEAEQARALSRMIVNNLSQNIELSIWFSTHAFVESSGDLHDPEWGLLDYDYTPRESFYAMKTVNERLSAPVHWVANPLEMTVSPGSSSRRVEVFERENPDHLTLAIWQARWPVNDSYSGYAATVQIRLPESTRIEAYDGLTGQPVTLNRSRNGEWIQLSSLQVKDYPVFLDIHLTQLSGFMTY